MSDVRPNETVMPARLKTLTAIEYLIHLYWSPERFEPHAPAMHWLLDNKLVIPRSEWWEVTDRGKAYVEAIRALPLPEPFMEWRIPR